MNEPAMSSGTAETRADRRPLPQVWVSGGFPTRTATVKPTGRRSSELRCVHRISEI